MEGLIFGGSYMYIGRTLYMEGPIYTDGLICGGPYMQRALYAKGLRKGPYTWIRAIYMEDIIWNFK